MIRIEQRVTVEADAKFMWAFVPADQGYPWSMEFRSGSDVITVYLNREQLEKLRTELNKLSQKREETTPCPS